MLICKKNIPVPSFKSAATFKGNLQAQHLLQFYHKRVYLPFVFIQNNTSENLLCNNIEGFYYFKLVDLWKFFYRKETNQNKIKKLIFWEDKFSKVHRIKSSIVDKPREMSEHLFLGQTKHINQMLLSQS